MVTREFKSRLQHKKGIMKKLTDYEKLTLHISRELHDRLVTIRRDNPTADKVTFFTEDDVIWENISMLLDFIKLLEEKDPVFNTVEADGKPGQPDRENLFPKIIMGSVML